jgi:hypothetical protein
MKAPAAQSHCNPNGNAPITGNDRGAEQINQADGMNFDTITALAQPSPAFASLSAGLSSAGYTLHELADGTYLACRWGYSRACTDLYAVRAFLRQVGGANK